jgi:ABC-type dipeptide/oligopeptide/nickel transport system permease component
VLIFAGDKPLIEERAASIRHQLGLTAATVQYWDYAAHALRGDLASAFATSDPWSTAS